MLRRRWSYVASCKDYSLPDSKTTKHCTLQVASTKDMLKRILPSWLKQSTFTTALFLQLASGAVWRDLVNLVLLSILQIGIIYEVSI
jgi:hypothetical protein